MLLEKAECDAITCGHNPISGSLYVVNNFNYFNIPINTSSSDKQISDKL